MYVILILIGLTLRLLVCQIMFLFSLLAVINGRISSQKRSRHCIVYETMNKVQPRETSTLCYSIIVTPNDLTLD